MEIKVISFDMRRIGRERDRLNLWKYRKQPMIEMLKKYSPDILCVQEDNVIQQRLLARELNMNFVGKYSGYGKGHGTNECNSILFKKSLKLLNWGFLWLGKNQKKPSQFDEQSKYYRVLIYAKLKLINGKVITIANTHLDHLENARIKSINILKEKISNRKKYILCGDFNTNMKMPSMILLEKYFKDSTREIRTAKTLLDWAGIFGLRVKTDYIFSNMRVKYCKVINDFYKGQDGSRRYFSDHKPILVTLKI